MNAFSNVIDSLFEILFTNDEVAIADKVPVLYTFDTFVSEREFSIVPINPDAMFSPLMLAVLYALFISVFDDIATIPADSFFPSTFALFIMFVSVELDALATTPALIAYVSSS